MPKPSGSQRKKRQLRDSLIAGMFVSQGLTKLYSSKFSGEEILGVQIFSLNWAVANMMVEHFGLGHFVERGGNPRKPLFVYRVNGESAVVVLERLLPHIPLEVGEKRERAEDDLARYEDARETAREEVAAV